MTLTQEYHCNTKTSNFIFFKNYMIEILGLRLLFWEIKSCVFVFCNVNDGPLNLKQKEFDQYRCSTESYNALNTDLSLTFV